MLPTQPHATPPTRYARASPAQVRRHSAAQQRSRPQPHHLQGHVRRHQHRWQQHRRAKSQQQQSHPRLLAKTRLRLESHLQSARCGGLTPQRALPRLAAWPRQQTRRAPPEEYLCRAREASRQWQRLDPARRGVAWRPGRTCSSAPCQAPRQRKTPTSRLGWALCCAAQPSHLKSKTAVASAHPGLGPARQATAATSQTPTEPQPRREVARTACRWFQAPWQSRAA